MSQTGKKIYTKLFDHLDKTRSIESAIQLCEWDQYTYMPEAGISFRSLTTANLSEIHHKLRTSASYKKLLGSLIDLTTGEIIHSDLSPKEIANIKILKEDYEKQSKLPVKFVKSFTKLTSTATFAWEKAKDHSDFKSFLPHLTNIVKASRKKADLLGFKHHPYDALIDLYEPGMTTQILDALFETLKFELVNLLKKIKVKNKQFHPIDKRSSFHHQMHFGRELIKAIGLKPELSRLDTTAHPFCSTVGPSDIRLTTKVIEDDFTFSAYSCLHEGGHGLYSLGLSKYALGLPEGQSVSLGFDESQSRLYETRIGQSRSFIEAITPMMKEHLKLPNLTANAFYENINKVEPGFIRIESDEISYCLHIILRYEIEKALIEGSITADKIPSIWNDKMESYLGLLPTLDSQGCLQDVHWSCGSIGYFPTYALGNIYAASIYDSFKKSRPSCEEELKTLNLTHLQAYLQKNIYDHGRLLKPMEVISKMTGSGLDPQAYLNYLKEKYSDLYDLKD